MRRTVPRSVHARITGAAFVCAVLATAAAIGATSRTATDASPSRVPDAPDWTRDVRPILSNGCFTCHGPDDAARAANLRLDTIEGQRAFVDGIAAVVPGDPAASLLMQRVRAEDPDLRMPPAGHGKTLEPREIAILEAWIEAGAPVDPHWAFESPRVVAPRLELPDDSPHRDWVRSPIDSFVLARLSREGIAPSPEADRRTLARRVSLDLVGLPPEPERLARFLADDADDAYERYVDELLASAHYGERWARPWLDLARYADTKGYEADRPRTIWPWRDWLVRALNDDVPYDRFTIEMLAGDLLPDATEETRLATAFHRNTMTNDEGGTQDEEFRIAAVVDRVNTTFEVWTGLTMACAQCHTHKYDPITIEEYYEAFAIFDQTQDADRMDDAPLLAWLPEAERKRVSELRARRTGLTSELRDAAVAIAAASAASKAPAPASGDLERRDLAWIDGVLPPGATAQGERWTWSTEHSEDDAPGGARASVGVAAANTTSQHFFDDAAAPIVIRERDRFVVHVRVDPKAVPRQIMIQWHARGDAPWEHRAYWGEDHVPWGTSGTSSRRRLGELPTPGEWVRLEIPIDVIGLEPGERVDGVAFTQHGGPRGGRVLWSGFGIANASPSDAGIGADSRFDWQVDPAAWIGALRSCDGRGASDAARRVLDLATAADVIAATWLAETASLDRLDAAHLPIGTAIDEARALRRETAALEEALRTIESARVDVPILAERDPADRRTTHVLLRGAWRDRGEIVRPGTPALLHAEPTPRSDDDGASDERELDRLDFARWLVSRDNPLAARVEVNRLWESLFGRGIVLTAEDFGVQGEPPSHPELLDWLAVRFMDGGPAGWSRKAILREIVTSATYRQSSAMRPELLERDPANELLARAPRVRLEAETIRDQALAIGGVLDRSLHGPPVFPPQPDGIWDSVYSGARWSESTGGDARRRSLYTYWKRTAPYPAMLVFDAPSREVCTARRIRTNTPLQALVTLNDTVHLEAAAGLAARMLTLDGTASDAERIALGFERATARRPTEPELQRLVHLLGRARSIFASADADPSAYLAASRVLDDPALAREDPTEAAAWCVLAGAILNLDEVLTRS